jgi:type I restriction enzyme S subunit
VAEDGENLRTRKTPISFLASGKFWVNNHAHILSGTDATDVRFLAYRLECSDVSAYLTGSTQPKLTQRSLLSMSFPWPTLSEQGAIADVLESLDSAIEANLRIAEREDELARALFEGSLQDAADVRTVESLATVVLGGTPDRKEPAFWTDGTVPWVNSGKANDFRVLVASELITQEALARSAAKLMPVGSTVVAITGATLGRVSRLELAAAGNQSLVGIWAESTPVNDWIYFWLRSRPDLLTRHATGGAQQHVNKGVVAEVEVSLPSGEALERWSSFSRPLLEHTAAVLHENLRLEALRDALVPPLMSGELRVREAETLVGDVL